MLVFSLKFHFVSVRFVCQAISSLNEIPSHNLKELLCRQPPSQKAGMLARELNFFEFEKRVIVQQSIYLRYLSKIGQSHFMLWFLCFKKFHFCFFSGIFLIKRPLLVSIIVVVIVVVAAVIVIVIVSFFWSLGEMHQ